MEELASAGEELLERVLKGDCLKRSSRKGLEENVMQEPSCSFHLRAGNRKKSSSGYRCQCSPGHAERCAVFIFVSFADFFCNTKTPEGTRVKPVCFYTADMFYSSFRAGANGPSAMFFSHGPGVLK